MRAFAIHQLVFSLFFCKSLKVTIAYEHKVRITFRYHRFIGRTDLSRNNILISEHSTRIRKCSCNWLKRLYLLDDWLKLFKFEFVCWIGTSYSQILSIIENWSDTGNLCELILKGYDSSCCVMNAILPLRWIHNTHWCGQ